MHAGKAQQAISCYASDQLSCDHCNLHIRIAGHAGHVSSVVGADNFTTDESVIAQVRQQLSAKIVHVRCTQIRYHKITLVSHTSPIVEARNPKGYDFSCSTPMAHYNITQVEHPLVQD